MKKNLQLISTKGMSREDWLAYRHRGLGASEVGAVLGLDDYTSSLELYYYKIGDLAKFDTETMASFMGRETEDLTAKLWQYWDGDEESMIRNFRAGKIVRRCQRVNGFLINEKFPWLYVSLDRRILRYDDRGEGALELKQIGGYEADKWEARLPPKYVTQMQTQLTVGEFLFGEMAVMEDGRRLDVLPFDFNENISNMVLEGTKKFWDKVVAGRKLVNEKFLAMSQFNQARVDELQHQIDALAPEPDGSLAYAQFLSKKFNKPNSLERPGGPQELLWAQELLTIADQLKDLQEQRNLRESQLKVAMADVQILNFGMDGKVYWSKTEEDKRYFRNKVRA